jgi:peptidyl-prolyl cis-trans isomerase SurA
MRRAWQFALLLLAFVPCRAQEVVDRMVAVVNKRVVLESELEQATRVQFLLQGKPLNHDQPRAPEAQAVLDQLIDRSLLEQQIADPSVLDPTPEELAARIQEVRAQLPGAATDEGWKKMLGAYGLTQQDVENHFVSEFRVLRFVDLRFRGLVRVDKASIASYYEEKLVPELRRKEVAPPPLAEVSGRIEKILVEQRMDTMLNEWLQTLRAQAHIEKIVSSGNSPAPEVKP